MAKAFPLFPHLPAELRLKIWESSCRKPGIHIFDVCYRLSTDTGGSRSQQAFTGSDGTIADEVRYQSYRNQVFLDTLHVSASTYDDVYTTTFSSDPSMYKFTQALSTACIDSARVIKLGLEEEEGVYLPGKRKRIFYDNTSDVLCLRFGSSNAEQGLEYGSPAENSHPIFQNNISRALEAMWSPEMAASLCSARRVAIDISELWSTVELDLVIIEEIAILCSCIQNGLETVYLVDYCVGRCKQCWKGTLMSEELLTGKCDLARELDPEDREMDIVYGTGVRYREICNFHQLGWDSDHPLFVLAQTMGNTIREQQGQNGLFRSVRVLVCDDEATGGDGRIVNTSCMKASTI